MFIIHVKIWLSPRPGSVFRPLEEVALLALFEGTHIEVASIVGSQFKDGPHQGPLAMMTHREVQIGPLEQKSHTFITQ